MSDDATHEPILRVRGLSAGYAGEHVVRGIDLDAAKGEAVAVIGSNGAGKSTLFRGIVGLLRGTTGTVELEGGSLTLPSSPPAADG